MRVRERKVAVVTGPIAGETAHRLLQSGFALVINYASTAAEAEALMDSLRSDDDATVTVKVEAADPDRACAPSTR